MYSIVGGRESKFTLWLCGGDFFTPSFQDYRFMPEPNLPPLKLCVKKPEEATAEELDLINVPALRRELPRLPASTRQNLAQKYKLDMRIVVRIVVSLF